MENLDRINELVGNKEFNEAKELIEKILENGTGNIELLKLAGLTYVNLELWENAQKMFESVIKYDSEDATSWFYLGNCYEKLKDVISAKNAYLKVIQFREGYTEAYKKLAIVYLNLKQPSDAVKYAELALKYDNEDYIYDFIIGTAYMEMRDFSVAYQSLQKALEKAPEQVEVLNSIGTCSTALNKLEDAVNYYKKALEYNAYSATTYFNLGSVYQIKQEHETAIKYFKNAIEIHEDERYIAALALSEIKLKDYQQALIHYKQLMVQYPSRENYKFNVVTCYEALGENDIAIKMLEEMLYLNPKYILPAHKLSSLYLKTQQYAKAKQIYDNILLKNNPTASVLHDYAILSSTLHDTETAEKILKKVIRMSPDSASAHKDLAIIFLNKRLFDYAEDEFKIALSLEPNSFDILFEYGNYLYSISRNNEAERYYAESLEIQPDNVLALVFMALNKLVLNQLDDAHKYIMKAIKLEPDHEYVQFCAGRILFAQKEYEEAKRYLIKAVEANPDIETLNTLALTYYNLDDYNQALNIFLNIHQKSPKSVSVLMDIAKCYEKLEENDNALLYLDKLVEIFPDDEDAHEMIRKLS